MTLASLALSPLALAHGSSGLSEEAVDLQERIAVARGLTGDVAAHQDSRWRTLQEVEKAFEECSADGWDGHEAAAVDPRTYANAVRWVLSLPREAAGAEVTVEPDGEIALEWHRSPQRFLIVSIGMDRELTYTWRFGHERAWGVRHFEDEIPSEVMDYLGGVTR